MIQPTIVQIESISTKALLCEIEKIIETKLARLEPPAPQDRYITRNEVAEIFSISLPTVHSWMNVGILKAYKIGNKTRFLLNEVKATPRSIARKYIQE